MSLQDEVRRALQPLIDEGLVHTVEAESSVADGGGHNPGQQVPVTVLLNADDPEAHRVDIMKLILQAGLKVDLRLLPNPSRSDDHLP
jgi:hypothetical protein